MLRGGLFHRIEVIGLLVAYMRKVKKVKAVPVRNKLSTAP
jgi:hypothetical protein